jgi:hypothetical protein
VTYNALSRLCSLYYTPRNGSFLNPLFVPLCFLADFLLQIDRSQSTTVVLEPRSNLQLVADSAKIVRPASQSVGEGGHAITIAYISPWLLGMDPE